MSRVKPESQTRTRREAVKSSAKDEKSRDTQNLKHSGVHLPNIKILDTKATFCPIL